MSANYFLLGTFLLGIFLHPTDAFAINPDSVSSREGHYDLTRLSFLQITADFFTTLAKNRTIQLASPYEMFFDYYHHRIDTTGYTNAILDIIRANRQIGYPNEYTATDPTWHFDDEQIQTSNLRLKYLRIRLYQLITNGDQNLARQVCGQALHVLQDFYSHTNWLELGNTVPHLGLGVAGANIGTTAPTDFPTCRNCTMVGNQIDCSANLLPEVTSSNYLTSGYRTVPTPTGKCAHGTTPSTLLGGINKDTTFRAESPHFHLHREANAMARLATINFLKKLYESLDDDLFAEFLNIKIGKSLTIVMDTTSSMQNYIDAAKNHSIQLIEAGHNQSGIENPIKNFVLVPFNDPEFGPAIRTRDSEEFKREILKLKAYSPNNFDNPEMCLSGLLLASQTSDEGSVIFVFTDADPKDFLLEGIVTSSLQTRKQTVYFFFGGAQQPHLGQVYRNIVQRTGGKVLITEKTEESIYRTTALMEDVIQGGSIILVQLNNMADLVKNLTFFVDSAVTTVDILLGHAETVPVAVIFLDGGAQRFLQTIIDTPTTKLLRFTQPPAGVWYVAFTAVSPGWFAEIKGQSYFNLIATLSYPGARILEGNPITGEKLTLSLASSCDECHLTSVDLLNPYMTSGSLETRIVAKTQLKS